MKYILLYAVSIIIMYASCTSSEGASDISTGLYGKHFKAAGMEYIEIAHVDAGSVIINLTKDSLEAEYYKQQLNK